MTERLLTFVNQCDGQHVVNFEEKIDSLEGKEVTRDEEVTGKSFFCLCI
jgi:hypothetical protein